MAGNAGTGKRGIPKGLHVTRIRNTQIKPEDIAYPQGTVRQVLIVPSTKDGDKPISDKELNSRTEQVQKFMAGRFGGFTEVRSSGGWVSDKLGVVKERNVQVVSYSNKKDWTVKNQRAMVKFGRDKAREWGQEAVGYEVEDDMFFLKQSEARKKAISKSGKTSSRTTTRKKGPAKSSTSKPRKTAPKPKSPGSNIMNSIEGLLF